jgi:hypothetical protein
MRNASGGFALTGKGKLDTQGQTAPKDLCLRCRDVALCSFQSVRSRAKIGALRRSTAHVPPVASDGGVESCPQRLKSGFRAAPFQFVHIVKQRDVGPESRECPE